MGPFRGAGSSNGLVTNDATLEAVSTGVRASSLSVMRPRNGREGPSLDVEFLRADDGRVDTEFADAALPAEVTTESLTEAPATRSP